MDVMTEHGELYSAELVGWLDDRGDLRIACKEPDCPCHAARIAYGWREVFTLNPGKRAALFTPPAVPVTPENVHVITTLAPADQTHAIEGG